MDFLTLAKERYSCRKFKDQPVEQEKIDKIIEAAILAPSATNAQPVHFWLINSVDGLKKINEVTPYGFGASNIIVVGGKPAEAWIRKSDGKNFSEVDAAIAASHIILAVHALGLRTTWVGVIDIPKIKELFPEMAEYEIVGLFPIGYADDSAAGQPSKRHFMRKTRDEIVTIL